MKNTNWDEKLESATQKSVARLVHELPEDEVSMAWRSALNEKLFAARKPKRRSWLVWGLPTVGVAAAAVLATVLILKPTTSENRVGLEQSILDAHSQMVAANELGTLRPADVPSRELDSGTQFDSQDLTPL